MKTAHPASATPATTHPDPTVSLVLAGGNALGAYAAGAVEALETAGVRFDLICGASIGAITAAIVAGNPPGEAAQALRTFWALSSSGSTGAHWPWMPANPWLPLNLMPRMPERREPNPNREMREMSSAAHALQTLLFGRPGLFNPSSLSLLPLWPGLRRPMALFDARPVVQTLERLLDFERLHTHGPQLIVCAVDLETGEPVYFDSRRERITPRHLLASTALPPGFPPVEIDGRLLGDPGLLCNLPLDPVLQFTAGDRLCFAVDLFSGAGDRPHSFDDAMERAQDVLFSGQSARTLQAFRREQRLRHQLQQTLQDKPHQTVGKARTDRADTAGETEDPPGQVDLVLTTYRPAAHEIGAKTLDFSADSLADRWVAGQRDMAAALAARKAGQADIDDLGFRLYRERLAEPPAACAFPADSTVSALPDRGVTLNGPDQPRRRVACAALRRHQ